jgi:hypothetical protein
MPKKREFNTSKLTEQYISEHPSIKDGLRKDVINYSALARLIADDLKITKRSSFDAVVVACRRYAAKLEKGEIHEEKIRDVLKKSRLEMKNKVGVFILRKGIGLWSGLEEIEKEVRRKTEFFHSIEGSAAVTVIAPQEYEKDISKKVGSYLLKQTLNLVEVRIRSPEDLEKTSGVVAYLSYLLAEQGINVVEMMSCWTDTIFIIEEKDVPKTMEKLRIG